jgi:type IV pilus assembly protein PilC
MLFSRLSLSALIELCRVLRHYLGAGLSLVDVFRQQSTRGPAAVRPVAGRIVLELEAGHSLEDALEREQGRFPPLFLSLASVGERTGMLPEVFGELERYFLRQKQLRQQFLARTAWPVLQFVLAIVVLALLIFFLGQLNTLTPDGKRYDPLGLGLAGASGAAIFVGTIVGVLAGMFGLYLLLSRVLAGRATVSRWLLAVPALGPCLQALALGRFCLALRLTTETGMSVGKALRLSLRATGNSAFTAAGGVVSRTVREGDDLTLALTRTGLFPDDLLRIVSVAEASGTLAEVMKHQSDHYHEEASRRLAVLTAVAGYLVWGVVGTFIIVAIFRLYGSYLSLLSTPI